MIRMRIMFWIGSISLLYIHRRLIKKIPRYFKSAKDNP